MESKPKVIVLLEKLDDPQTAVDLFVKTNFGSLADYKIILFDGSAPFDPKPFGDEKVNIVTTIWGSFASIKKILEANPSVDWVHSLNSGVDKMMCPELNDIKPVLTNSRGCFSEGLAEFAIFQMLWFDKGGQRWWNQKQKKEWKLWPMEFLCKKTVGIIGFGSIGHFCAKKSKLGFGMKVIAHKRNTGKLGDASEEYVDEIVGLDKIDYLLEKADYIINCLPLTDQTKGYYNLEKFKKMKKSAVFLNIGRGKNVVEKDLIEALQQGIIAGAYLDVFEKEPLPADSPLWEMDNVFITPHSAAGDTWEPSIEFFMSNIPTYLKGDLTKLPNIVEKTRGY